MSFKKVLKIIFVSVLALAAVLALLIPYLINMMINRPRLAQPKQLEDNDYTEFSARNENGHKIFALFYKGRPENAVVILCHGHGVTHAYLNDMVGFLRKAGLGIILFDFRAHGKSEGKLCSIGLHEWNDIKQVVIAAKEKGFIDESTDLVAYGRSMGAASLINGSTQLQEIKAFILESSFERLKNIAARDAWHKLRMPNTFFNDLVFAAVDFVTSTEFSKNNPEETIAGIATRPAMLIHDELDHRANQEAFEALKKRLPSAETMVVKNARHVQAHKVSEEMFERRFLEFLTKSGVKWSN